MKKEVAIRILLVMGGILLGSVLFQIKEKVSPTLPLKARLEESGSALVDKEATQEKATYQVTLPENREEAENTPSSATEEDKPFVYGMEASVLERIGISWKRLNEGLYQWCLANGYSYVEGVSIYPEFEVNLEEQYINFMLEPHIKEEGNGILPEENPLLWLRYYYDRDEFLVL